MLEPSDARKQREVANKAHLEKKAHAVAAKKQRAAAKKQAAAAQKQHECEIHQHETTASTTTTSKRTCRVQGDEDPASDDDDEDLPSCLHPDNPSNFLKLGHALRLLLGREVTDDQIDEADQLLCEYCQELVEVSLIDLCQTSYINLFYL